jgi:hypothetical protein
MFSLSANEEIIVQRFENDKLPLLILKAYSKILLLGLHYLHSTCGVVHTGKFRAKIVIGI